MDKSKAAQLSELVDIRSRLPDFAPRVILDVGANIGENASAYAETFPDAKVHAFEPVPATFEMLNKNTCDYKNVQSHNVALGSEAGMARMWTQGTSPGAFIIQDEKRRYQNEVHVRVERGDGWAAKMGIESISYLKIDAEGHDLQVLIGFGMLLEKTDLVQVEASMNPHNRTHVPFRQLEDLLRLNGFLLFKFYEQSFEFFHGGHPVLRRTNPLFINKRLTDLSKFDE